MRAFFAFCRAWLFLCFVLAFFVVPLYLIAIYPDVPEPYLRVRKGLGYGVVQAPPSELGFWYRLAACGATIAIGLLLVWDWVRGRGSRGERRLGK